MPAAPAAPVGFEHPAAALIPAELRDHLDGYAITNVRYPPYQSGYPGAVPGEWFMRTYQKDLYQRIEGSVGLPTHEFQRYLEPVLVQFAELAHLLPASENHHHSGPGGLLRHSLEVANLTMDRVFCSAMDAHEIPAKRSLRRFRWNVAGVIAGLLHDAGKPLSDITAVDHTGEHRWNYGAETLHQWSMRLKIQRYFLLWNADRHGRHVETSVMLLGRLVPTATIEWLLEGGPDIQQAMIEAVAGTGNSMLAEAVRWADGASVQREMRRGNRTGSGGDTGIPVVRLVFDAMQRLLGEGRWTVNVPGSRVWTTIDGVFIAWTQGASEVVELIARDGMPIPRSADTLAGVLQSHGVIEPPPTGELYWVVTPHPLMRGGRGPALKCIKLCEADQLYPAALIPPPVSVTLGREGQQQQQLIAPNAAPAESPVVEATPPEPATAASTEPAVQVRPENAAPVEDDPLAAVCGPLPGAPLEQPATEQKPAKHPNHKNQQPNLPAAASPGIRLVPETATTHGPTDTAVPPATPDAQPEEQVEAFTLDEMLRGLTPNAPVVDQPGPETRAEKSTALVPEATPAQAVTPPADPDELVFIDGMPNRPLRPGEKVSLDVLLGKGRRKASSPRPAPAAAPKTVATPVPTAPTVQAPAAPPAPVTPPQPASGWAVPAETAARLNRREVLLLQRHPALAQKLLQVEQNQTDAKYAYSKVFLALRSCAFDEQDIPALLEAGWIWQDFLAEGDGILRTLKLHHGFVLSADISRILVKLMGCEKVWSVPSTDDFSEAELDALPAIIDEIIASSTLDETTPMRLWSITPAPLVAIAERHGMQPQRLEEALYAMRDAIRSSARKRIYIRPLPKEILK